MLLVHSRSTEKYAEDWYYDQKMLVVGPPTVDTLFLPRRDEVVAIGGGSVIDTAKIISINPIIAVPTTYSGASRTSHAVYWDGKRKFNFNVRKPITIVKPEYLEGLPEEVKSYSKADCICHAIESLNSKKLTDSSRLYASTALELIEQGDWLNASLLAGDAVEITGTNVVHALSYALTAIYKVPHAKALFFLLPRFTFFFALEDIKIESGVNLDIDVQQVVDEALTYPKVFDCNKLITRNLLLELLR